MVSNKGESVRHEDDTRWTWTRIVWYGKLLFLGHVWEWGGLMSLLWMAVGEMPGENVRCPGGAVDRKQVGKSHMQTRF